ncbi:MAG: baseplate J/gp47 family protein, partial [Ruminiclostridium sp.]|nr:baseplate J/gp47 family protein [Ruminiclostridium sp.]
TEGFTKVGISIFLDNHGFRLTELFGRELYWIRITDVKDFYMANPSSRPVIRGISRNAVGAVNLDSHAEEYFTMNIYAENTQFELAAKSILSFELYVNEFSTLTEAEAEELERQGKLIRVTGSDGIDTELWVKWEEVNTFITENSLSRSYVIDRGNGIFTFGNGRNGRIPAVSEDDNIRVVYTTGGGRRTNVEVGRIGGIERSIGFVSGVTNPKQFYGGCDIETVYEAIERSAVMLRTQGKAIAGRDYERLTMCASRCVERVRCFRGVNSTGLPERGAVTLVVMKKDSTEFSKVSEDIRHFLLPRIAGGIVSSDLLYITEPTFVIINVRAEIAVREINGIFDLKKNVEEKLRTYIDSYCGGKNDRVWKLGRTPNEQQLRSAILRIPEILYIRNIYITTYISGPDGLVETDDEGIRKYAFILPVSGEHDISVVLA